MDAALITGMFNIGFSASGTKTQDVFKNADSDFNNIFSKELDNKKGFLNEKENIKEVKKEVVNKKDEINKRDEEKVTDVKKEDSLKDESRVEKKTDNKKDEENKVDDKINGLVEKIMTCSENIDVENLEELKNTIESLMDVESTGITTEELLKIQEELKLRLSQNVFEVGPQSVETEKIKLNKYDELEKRLEELRKKFDDSSDVENDNDLEMEANLEMSGESMNSEFESYFDEQEGLNSNTDGKEDRKFNISDFRKKDGINEKVDQLDFNVDEIKTEVEDIAMNATTEVFETKATNMQEQIDVIRQISEKVDINLFEDKSEMIIKLKPDHLGKVTVEIAVENGNITAKFLAESQKVKEILESNMQDLKDHLAKQGMMIQDLSVSVGDQNKEPVFEQRNYKSFKRKQNNLEVENNIYAGGSPYGMEVREPSYYWPDSTVSFSA